MNYFLEFNAADSWLIAGWTMLHFLWLGTLVAVVAVACRWLLLRTSPNVRYVAALGCLMLLTAMPCGIGLWLVQNASRVNIADSAKSARGVNHPAKANAVDNNIIELAPFSREAKPSAYPMLAVPAPPTTSPAPYSTTESPPANKPSPDPSLSGSGNPFAALEVGIPYLPWLWIIGTPITFGLLLTGIVGTRRLHRASRPITDGPIQELLARLTTSLRIGRRVSIAVCERIAAPVLVGIVRPLILLPPAALTGWSPDEIEMVLLHELAHVRRWDNLINLLQRCVESFLFFHPAVWFVSSWVRHERESCCDAAVVARTNRPHAYAEMLVALAAQMPRSVLFHPAASSAMAAGSLRGRIRRILGLEDDPMLASGKSLALMLATLLVSAALAVLYLPTIGQADQSATEATESTESTHEKRQTESAGDLALEPVLKPLSFALKRGESGQAVLYLNDQPIGEDVVRNTLPREEKRISKLQVSLRAETGIPYADVMRVVDLLESLGVKKLALDTRNVEGKDGKDPGPKYQPYSAASKFPSLEDQKLADLAWKRLGLELEPIGNDDLKRVKALGYDGGVRVVSGSAGFPGATHRIEIGNILVGLHVWPTTSMKDVAQILQREDLPELNPLKFYVVTQVAVDDPKSPGKFTSKDVIDAGRVSVLIGGGLGGGFGRSSSNMSMGPQPTTGTVESSDPYSDSTNIKPRPPVAVSAAPSAAMSAFPANPFASRAERLAPNTDALSTKSNLRYDGKSFYQWRETWKTELSTEKRAEAVKALAAFGRAGYGKEATEAILDVAGEYDFFMIDSTPEGKLKATVLAELAPDSRQLSMTQYWLPELMQRMHEDPKKWKWLAVNLLSRLQTDDKTTLSNLQTIAASDDTDLRGIALSVLIYSSQTRSGGPQLDDKTRKLIDEALQNKDPAIVRSTLQLLLFVPPSGAGGGGGGGGGGGSSSPPPQLRYRPAMFPMLLFHADEAVRRQARNIAQYLDEKDASQVVDQLLAVLQDKSRERDHIEAIRALAVLGSKAKPAANILEEIFVADKNHQRTAAAVALKAILGELDFNLLLGRTIAKELKIQVSDSGLISLPGRPDSKLYEAFSKAFQAEENSLLPSNPNLGGGFF